jgi:diguanylate cyclase (GGDEF)-like protein/PAS domain S-box-containing protein
MTFADFIRNNLDSILDEWEQFAHDIPSASAMDQKALRDHSAGILSVIADDLEQAQTGEQQIQKGKGKAPSSPHETEAAQHGAARLLEGFSVNDAMSEFRALRASVLRLWARRDPDNPDRRSEEVTRFNEAIDQALGESLERYSTDREHQTRLFDALLSSSPDLNFIAASDGRVLYANKAIAAMYGLAASELAGKNLFTLLEPVAADLRTHVDAVMLTHTPYRGEMVYSVPGTVASTYEYLLLPVLDEHDKLEAIAGTARDISERKANEERVTRSANYDSLTGLPNRNLFHDRLEHDLKHAARTGLALALMFIDLDGFKEVNDQLGHAAGDELLRAAAVRISDCVRDTDTVARLGGDEFTVILTDVTRESHVDVLAGEILDALNTPFRLSQQSVQISGSIGIALYPQHAHQPDALVRYADLAMYVAKHAGRNAYRLFSPHMRNKPTPS